MHFIILLYKAGLVFNFTFIYLVRWIQAFILQDWSYCGVHWRIHWVQTRVWGAKLLINFLSVTFANVKKAEQKKKKKNLISAACFTLIFRTAVWSSYHWGAERKSCSHQRKSPHQWIKASWFLKVKKSYLESRGQVVLEEPELDRSFGVLQNWQHHNPERE